MRVDLVERFEKLVADYNAGSMNTETFFQELLKFGNALTEEEARALSEGLTEEQLAIFDLLMRPAPELSESEKMQVKKVAEQRRSGRDLNPRGPCGPTAFPVPRPRPS